MTINAIANGMGIPFIRVRAILARTACFIISETRQNAGIPPFSGHASQKLRAGYRFLRTQRHHAAAHGLLGSKTINTSILQPYSHAGRGAHATPSRNPPRHAACPIQGGSVCHVLFRSAYRLCGSRCPPFSASKASIRLTPCISPAHSSTPTRGESAHTARADVVSMHTYLDETTYHRTRRLLSRQRVHIG